MATLKSVFLRKIKEKAPDVWRALYDVEHAQALRERRKGRIMLHRRDRSRRVSLHLRTIPFIRFEEVRKSLALSTEDAIRCAVNTWCESAEERARQERATREALQRAEAALQDIERRLRAI